VIRRGLACVLTLAVQAAATMAPFAHAHLDDHATDHHGGARAIHSHFGQHHHHDAHRLPPTHGPAIEDPDDDTPVVFPLFVAVGGQSFEVRPAALTFVALPAPMESPAHRSVQVVHGHDPPSVLSRPSRAPPAVPSWS
jgi:hypothetical protein